MVCDSQKSGPVFSAVFPVQPKRGPRQRRRN